MFFSLSASLDSIGTSIHVYIGVYRMKSYEFMYILEEQKFAVFSILLQSCENIA